MSQSESAIGPDDMAELASRLRRDGLVAIADRLTSADDGVLGGNELVMKWRFHLAQALSDRRLTRESQRDVETALERLNAALA